MNWFNGGVLRVAGLLVREPDRPAWLAEWESELWYVVRESEPADGAGLRFCLGAFRDALWMRRNGCASASRHLPRLQSPFRCVLYLTALAAMVSLIFFQFPGLIDPILWTSQNRREFMVVQLLMMGMALLLVLPTAPSLALGAYPKCRFRRWIFLLSKFALIFPAVYFGILDLFPIIGVPLLADAWVLGYVVGFRWALIDQRRRCPVCLRLLSSPTRIGEASHTLLGWYGTEFVCGRGHGLLHVPENQTSYTAQRWLELDPSWRSLFSGRPAVLQDFQE